MRATKSKRVLLYVQANCICRTRDGLEVPVYMIDADDEAPQINRRLVPGAQPEPLSFRTYALVAIGEAGLPIYQEI